MRIGACSSQVTERTVEVAPFQQEIVSVSHDGPGIRPRGDSPGLGLGIPLMAHLTKAFDLAVDGSGVTVLMKFALP